MLYVPCILPLFFCWRCPLMTYARALSPELLAYPNDVAAFAYHFRPMMYRRQLCIPKGLLLFEL